MYWYLVWKLNNGYIGIPLPGGGGGGKGGGGGGGGGGGAIEGSLGRGVLPRPSNPDPV